jgi:hypothetical protein
MNPPRSSVTQTLASFLGRQVLSDARFYLKILFYFSIGTLFLIPITAQKARDCGFIFSVRCFDSIRVHIGILTHSKRSHKFLGRHIGLWLDEFLESQWSCGAHFISETLVSNFSIPTVIVNETLVNPRERPGFLSRSQAQKTIDSLRYFVMNTSCSFFIIMTDNAFVYSKNFPYLIAEMKRHNLTGKSSFAWGNCMQVGLDVFLQGGVGVFISRETARRLIPLGDEWVPTVTHSEDIAFQQLLDQIGLPAVNGTSEYFLGQYCAPRQQGIMDQMNISMLEVCPRRPEAACRPFLAPFNRVVVLHRLSRLRFVDSPRPVYEFPDNVLWYQRGHFATFCRKES